MELVKFLNENKGDEMCDYVSDMLDEGEHPDNIIKTIEGDSGGNPLMKFLLIKLIIRDCKKAV